VGNRAAAGGGTRAYALIWQQFRQDGGVGLAAIQARRPMDAVIVPARGDFGFCFGSAVCINLRLLG
jgi:hypothetical protein